MSRYFVTGATGFIGSAIARQSVKDGHSVAILRRATSDLGRLASVLPDLQLIEGHLSDPAHWEERLADWKPDGFIHCAWEGVLGRLRNDPIQMANVETTKAMVEVAARTGCKVWIGLGSQAEYGPANQTIDESFPLNPTTLYGEAKVAAYHAAEATCAEAGLRFAWLRVFSTYGPGDSLEWMLPGLIEKLLNREKPALTAGEQLWDYLYVEDAARAVSAVAETPTAHGVFNLGSGEAKPLRGLIETIRDTIDPSLPLGFGEVPYRPDQVMILHANVDKLRKATNWSPQTTINEGIANTVAWHRSQY